MTRGRKPKQIYLYDPRTNVSTPTTYGYLAELLQVTERTLACTKSRKQKNRKLNCYITDDETTVQQRKKWYSKEKIESEIWKEIEGSDGLYLISNYGRFKRVCKTKLKFVLPSIKKTWGQLRINIVFLGERKVYKVSHLVAHHFIGRRPKGYSVYYINGIKTDCRAVNLDYATKKMLGKMTSWKARSKEVYLICRETGEIIDEFKSVREAAGECNFSHEAVRDRCYGRIKRIEDKIFMYAEDYEKRVNVNESTI